MTINKFLSYFFRGLLFVVPLAITIYVLYMAIKWMDGLLNISIPGVGLVVIVSTITIFGYLASTFITRPVFIYIEKAIEKIPLVSLIYTSLKDLISAFVGEKKRFNKPVLIKMNDNLHDGIYRMGFITKQDLSELGLKDLVAVYIPHSYNFSGNHFLISQNRIKPLDINSTTAMKFIVSGGISGI